MNTQPNSPQGAQMSRGRVAFVVGCALVLLGLVVARAYDIQVANPDSVVERRNWHAVTTERFVAPRGVIEDRNGNILADSAQTWDIYLDVFALYVENPSSVSHVRALLTSVPGFDTSVFDEWDAADPGELTRNFKVADRAAPDLYARINSAEQELGVVVFREEPVFLRVYPEQELAGSLLGFVDSGGEQGRAGLELGFNERLAGGSAEFQVQRNTNREPFLFGDVPDIRRATGDGLVLSIDSRLQRFVEATLRQRTSEFRAEEAMAVVSNARTGELLAVATSDRFDPNRPFDHEEDVIWGSHALKDAYEPGSTAKIVTFAAALNEGVIGFDTPIDCEGGEIEIDEERVRDTHPEDVIPAWKVLQVSSNIGALKMGMLLEDEVHHDYLRRFGFGAVSGIGDRGEARGILEPAPWIDIKQANMSFGHGFTSTILQTHLSTSVIAAGGVMMEPRLVTAILGSDGTEERFLTRPRERVVREDVARTVARAMERVVHHEDGTGKLAEIEGVRVAGKTGTAHLVDHERGGYYPDQYLASFTGFFPADDPEYVVTVWVLRPDPEIDHYGGKVAAPIFAEIGEECLRLYARDVVEAQSVSVRDALSGWERARLAAGEEAGAGQPGDTGSGSASSADDNSRAAVEAGEEPGGLPDFRGMWTHEAVDLAVRHAVELEVVGSGRVVSQTPRSGEPAEDVDTVTIFLGQEQL